MADSNAGSPKSGVLFGWLRAAVTSVVGLVGGACLMYFSPLIDKVIKPGAPVANFQSETSGLKVVFHNRSSNGAEGWWDFGDGSALEPFQPNQECVTHTYARPGSYAVKLSVRSLFGQESDRSVTVALDQAPASTAPAIEALQVIPLQANAYAPATFKVVTAVKNAEFCVLATGEDHPIEVVTDTSGTQEHYVTFKYPGTHVLQLAAYGNKQTVQKSQPVRVEKQPAGAVMAVLNVTHQVVYVETKEQREPLRIDFPASEKGSVANLSRSISARDGFSVVGARFDPDPAKDANVVRNARLEVSPDRKAVRLTCQLLKNPKGPTGWTAPVLLSLEKRSLPAARPMDQVGVQIPVPGKAVLPVPMPQGGWVSQQHSLSLQMQYGDRTIWKTTQLPRTDQFTLNGHLYRVTTTEVGNQVQVQVDEVRPGAVPVGN
jgi:PKD repeat protein